jgi:hypothetical protein
VTGRRPWFATSEALRSLLVRLHAAGPDAWRADPDAAALMAYAMEKYGALARKHHLEPEDAAVAAFEVMRTRAAREAQDPWAVVTRAVQVTLIAEERANGLLCSTTRARRAEVSVHHDAERFSDRETPVCDYHAAFHVAAEQDTDVFDEGPVGEEPTSAFEAVDGAAALFTALGWPSDTVRAGLDYICSRLISSGSRASAHESLRRDQQARGLLDLDRRSWAALLRIVLGNPNPDRAHTAAGRGVLMRLLIGYRPSDLLADDELVLDISRTAPRLARGPRS